MFPEKPRRPMPPKRPFPPRNPLQGRQQPSTKSNLMSHFQTPEGNLDFEKISATAKQMRDLYGQVSPMITRFIKK